MNRYSRIAFLVLLVLISSLTSAMADEETEAAYKATIEQIYAEAFNSGNLEIIDSSYATDYVNHGIGDDLDVEGFKTYITDLRAAMTDFAATIEVLIAEEDWAATRVLYSGTFENEWIMGDQTIPPTGEPVTWSLNIMHRFNEAGLIVEDFTAFDSLSLLTQLEAAPLPDLIANLLTSTDHTIIEMGETITEETSLDTHKAAFMHVLEDAINNGELTAIDTYMSDEHLAYEPFGTFTRAQFKQVIAGFRATIPDLHVGVDAQVAEGDWLAARLIYEGTFSNDLSLGLINIKATDKPIRFIVNIFVRYNEDGVSIQDFKEYNRLGWLQQIELIPAS